MILPKNCLFFVVNVGNTNSYSQYTLPYLNRYCKKYNYSLFIMDRILNEKVPPSWYKLLCHSICDSSFILCIDLDVFIIPSSQPIHYVLDENCINMTRDPNKGQIFSPFFKYNIYYWRY